jgi:hypothetical protein
MLESKSWTARYERRLVALMSSTPQTPGRRLAPQMRAV